MFDFIKCVVLLVIISFIIDLDEMFVICIYLGLIFLFVVRLVIISLMYGGGVIGFWFYLI